MKIRQLYTFFLPDLIPDGVLADATAVVIDILRATTTMTTGLANGAARIIPCVGVDQANLVKQRLLEAVAGNHSHPDHFHPKQPHPKQPHPNRAGAGGEDDFDGRGSRVWPPVLLGGERLGKPLPGFDLGNAPATYDADTVGGRTLVMTTTNGTRAMDRCRGARQIVIGSFANLSRIVQHLHGASRVALVCSGTDRHVTCEDVVFAGAVAEELIAAAAVDAPAWELNDGSKLARCYWQSLVRAGRFPPGEALVELFRHSLGGANLVAQGRAADLEFAARIDRFSNLPVLDQADWQITNHP